MNTVRVGSLSRVLLSVKRLIVWLLWRWHHQDSFGRSTPAPQPRLLVDVSNILRHDAQTGIQRVVRAIWSELRRSNDQNWELQAVYAAHDHGYAYAPNDFLERRDSILSKEPVRAGPSDRFLGLDLSAHVLPRHRDQIIQWQASGASIHIVVYDLLPILRPDWFTPSNVANFKRWLAVIEELADQLFCISSQVAIDLAEHCKAEADRAGLPIAQLLMGGDIEASHPTSGLSDAVDVLLGTMAKRPAILMVGTVEPRKGYGQALAVMEYLWSQTENAPDLVIVGKKGWNTSDLQRRIRRHPKIDQRLHWIEEASDEDLCRLYRAASGLLMASLGEGFGLPLIEAAAHGCPMIVRDLPVFREQKIEGIRFFNSDSPEVLGPLIMQMVHGEIKPPQLPSGIPTWEQSVRRLLDDLKLSEPSKPSFAVLASAGQNS